jgi:hypothetical protein
VAAEVMVMPRSCSCSMKSMVAAPSCTSPILWETPRVKQDALGGGGLAGINVGHDAEIAITIDGGFTRHYGVLKTYQR